MRCWHAASILALLCLPSIVGADATLNLSLPSSRPAPPPAREAAPSGAARRDSTSFGRYNRQHTSRGVARQAESGIDRRAMARPPKERVVGRLGVAGQACAIRSGRSSRRRVLANVQAGTYLALTQDNGSWFGVLMADRTTGWIRKSDVNVLDYQVVSPEAPAGPRYAESGGGAQLLSGGQRSILDVAYGYLGVPYKWGGTSPNGLDCSAFVQRCFAAFGVRLPRTAHEQYDCGLAVSPEQLQAADRLYFASRDGRITHTGIYIGNGYFIHASSSRGGVAVSRLSEPLYRRMFAGARR